MNTALPQLSLVFPAYNEENRLPASLARVLEYLRASGLAFEILVVDDGSSDRTAQRAEEVAAGDERVRVLRYEPNRGKGFAVAYGMQRAVGEYVLFSDADLSTPIEELPKLLGRLQQGCDVAIASRALPESQLQVRQPWWRERMGRLMNCVIRTLSGLPYPDTQCGFKLFSRRAAQDIFPQLTVRTWMFDVEVLVLARMLDYRVAEVPVTWINNEDSRVKASHIRRVIRELVQIRLHWLRHRPERRFSEEAGVAAQTSP